MAQGAFAQALRKEAALSSTFMKGRSLMLNGAVLSFEDSGSRFSKNVHIEGTVRGSRGDLYKTHVALDMDEHEVIDYDCDCPAAFRYSGMCKHAIATALAYLDASGAEPVEGLRTPVRTFTVPPAQSKPARRPAPTASAVNPNFPFPAPSPRAQALWRRFPIFRTRAWMSSWPCVASSPAPLTPMRPKRCWSPRWCRTTIRCLPIALTGRLSFAFAAVRCPTWSRISTAWPMPMCAAVRSPMVRSLRLSMCPRRSMTCRQSCSTLSQ